MTMSEKDLRLAAEKNIKIDSATQNKIMEDALAKTKARVEELRAREAEEKAAALEAERLANLPPMSKRQKIEADKKAQEEAQLRAVGIDPAGYQEFIPGSKPDLEQQFVSPMQTTIQQDLIEVANQTTVKPQIDGSTFRPFAVSQQKVKIEQVPSYGLSYPKGWEIYVTPYSGDDLDDLNNSKLSLKYILTKCLEGVYTNFDKNSITFYDALYLSYYRRILSIDSNQIQVVSRCPHCDMYSTRIVDIEKEIEFEDSKIPSLPINVDFSFGRLSFTYLTYKNFMDLKSELKSEELAFQCTTACQVDKDQNQTREGELQKLFGSLVGTDAALLDQIRELTYHGIKPLTSLCQNKECGQSYETLIDEMSSIILPFRRSQEDIRSKISFG